VSIAQSSSVEFVPQCTEKVKIFFCVIFWLLVKNSHGHSTIKTCRCPQSFFPCCTHSPLVANELALLEDRKWGEEVANRLKERKWRTRGSGEGEEVANELHQTRGSCKREEATNKLCRMRGSGEQGSGKEVMSIDSKQQKSGSIKQVMTRMRGSGK